MFPELRHATSAEAEEFAKLVRSQDQEALQSFTDEKPHIQWRVVSNTHLSSCDLKWLKKIRPDLKPPAIGD